jgi:tetratricopeptide (TPR) repeat protein
MEVQGDQQVVPEEFMNGYSKTLIVSLLALLATTLGLAQTETRPLLISATEAPATLAAAARYAQVRHSTTFGFEMLAIDVSSIHGSPNELRLDAAKSKKPPTHLHLALKATDSFNSSCDDMNCVLTLGPENQPAEFRDDSQHGRYFLIFGTNGGFSSIQRHLCARAENKDECEHSAERFAAALNALMRSPLTLSFNADAFHKQAAAWRALATKPPLPDDVRVQRLLAEDALKNRKPGDALKCYEAGLSLYPTWPQGWFNAAIVASELGYYADAVAHMQNYLELVPDANDAQSARDQITIWQYKAKQSSTK